MELHHRAQTPRSRRVAAWIHSWQLDQLLASVVDPTQDPVLAVRAEKLSDLHTRHRLACSFRELVEGAERPACASSVAPVARTSVRARRTSLLNLADRLDRDARVGVRGIASANLLHTDGASPLWEQSSERELGEALESALNGLEVR